jgi:hypothetical protein
MTTIIMAACTRVIALFLKFDMKVSWLESI